MAAKTIGYHTGKSLDTLVLPDNVYRTSNNPVSSPELHVGLELEIEGWTGRGSSYAGFNFDTDGSLRNHGIEAISAPTKLKFVENLLTGFYSYFRVTPENYSERTSTHVHVNVLNLTLDQLAALCMVYQVFERVLFNFIGKDRDKNIFCVPWYQANVNVNLVDVIRSGKWRNLQRWSKYTAMNLLAVSQRGTVEFRHLDGTCDVSRIMDWVNILGCMHEYARVNSVEDIEKIVGELNTSSSYEVFLQSVFGPWANKLMTENYRLEMESGVIDAKIMLTKEYGLLEQDDNPQEINPDEINPDEIPLDTVNVGGFAFRTNRAPGPTVYNPWEPAATVAVNPNQGFNDLLAELRVNQAARAEQAQLERQALEQDIARRAQILRRPNPPGNPVPPRTPRNTTR